MKFVRNSFTYNNIPEPQDSEGILKFIEKIGRLCYRSDDLIKDDSAAGFIGRLKKRKHWAMLEHYIFTISIPEWIYRGIMDPKFYDIDNTDYVQKMKFVNVTRWDDPSDPYLKYLISGSATAFNYLWACKCVKDGENAAMESICEFLRYYHPHLMEDPCMRDLSDDPNDIRFDQEIRFLSRSVVKSLPRDLKVLHDWMSVHFVVERSSTHDLVRHRPMVSYGQESTRYCNYDRKGLCFIIPCQFSENDKQILENPDKLDYVLTHPNDVCYGMTEVARRWLQMIKQEADNYIELLNEFGMSPQEAKSVIPHALRAEINITTFMGEWYHIFKMRADKAAFPQIQEVMVPLLNETIHSSPDIFGNLEHLVEEGSRFVNAKC